MYELLPNVQHRHCVRHLHNNFKRDHPGLVLKQKMWKVAKATYIEKYQALMGSLREENEGAYTWLSNVAPRFWSRSHFRTETKCDILINNFCESLNSKILHARSMPILGMLEWLRIYMMQRLQNKRNWIAKHQREVCPSIWKRLEKYSERAAGYSCLYGGDGKFQINCSGGEQFVVDLVGKTCACRKWDLTGIPCSHAIRAILDNGEQAEDYFSHWYSRDMYIRAYSPVINPFNGSQMWPKINLPPILPPRFHVQPGRPKKARRREPDSPIKKSKSGADRVSRAVGKGHNKCGYCRVRGHSRKTCPTLIAEKNQVNKTLFLYVYIHSHTHI